MKSTDKLSNIALVIGFTLSLLALINGFAIVGYEEAQKDVKSQQMYRYINRATICSDNTDLEKYEEFLNSLPNTISNTGITFQTYIGENVTEAVEYFPLQIYFDCKIPILYKMMEGKLPDGSQDKPAVAIGYMLDKYTNERYGNKYILINGVECLVTGIIRDLKIEDYSDIILATSESLGRDAQKRIMEINVESKGVFMMDFFEETDSSVNIFESVDEKYYCDNNKNDFGIYESTIYSYDLIGTNEVEKYNNEMLQMYFMALSMFAIVSSLALSGLWFNAHKKEIAIRKLWGYTTLQLTGVLFEKLGALALASIVLAFVIQMPITIIWRDGFDVFGYLNVLQLITVIGVMAVITVVMTFIEVRKSKKITPADALRKYEY